ncbi:potassium channel subfamily K member 18 [Corythoichthys intestinalis]|uniref:potassium channel subfamily K member 18 n=1 Tax=Corythoichthys intestinalis TaxID=161448 RepID=UPI0025A58620|nr:potassium channel subfamily K member 18 [Corythoichthys intestinalis]XP_057704968.1 potassium channel subfamily K member 18 [Corythoichthys intestinalis]
MRATQDKQAKSPFSQANMCKVRMWKLLPHVMLCLSLVIYAALGACLFQYIEGRAPPMKKEYHDFLGDIILHVQNLTKHPSTHQNIVIEVEHKMKNFQTKWLQTPDMWTFFGAMFFVCTVFTTVGYGAIYPVTLPGKVACILYSMVGIPLMLLVMLDIGDFMATLLTKAIVHIHAFFKVLRSHCLSKLTLCGNVRESNHRTLEDGTIVYSNDIVIHELLNVREVLQSQVTVKSNSIQLQKNREIFEKILAKENLLHTGPLLRSLSCPELNQMPPLPKGFAIWDFTGMGDTMDALDVPFVLILFIVFAYIFLGGLILPIWETEMEGFDPYYFCFITLTTIGFGDIVPQHPNFFMLTSLFIIAGMAIMSMAFKLSQTRLVDCYRHCISIISRGNTNTAKD